MLLFLCVVLLLLCFVVEEEAPQKKRDNLLLSLLVTMGDNRYARTFNIEERNNKSACGDKNGIFNRRFGQIKYGLFAAAGNGGLPERGVDMLPRHRGV